MTSSTNSLYFHSMMIKDLKQERLQYCKFCMQRFDWDLEPNDPAVLRFESKFYKIWECYYNCLQNFKYWFNDIYLMAFPWSRNENTYIYHVLSIIESFRKAKHIVGAIWGLISAENGNSSEKTSFLSGPPLEMENVALSNFFCPF